ncbi:MAG: holo-ACP synthase [Bacillota bacterium]
MADVILGLGTDVIEISRIGKAVRRHGDSFLRRVYTPKELKYAGDGNDRYRRLAGRWAAKEAVRKTLGANLSGVSWKDVEVLPGEFGEPVVRLAGQTKRIVDQMGGNRIHLSLSHSGGIVIAFALMVAREGFRAEGRTFQHGR